MRRPERRGEKPPRLATRASVSAAHLSSRNRRALPKYRQQTMAAHRRISKPTPAASLRLVVRGRVKLI